MGRLSDRDLFLINQRSLMNNVMERAALKDAAPKDSSQNYVPGTGRISDLPSTIPSINNLPENTQMQYQWFWNTNVGWDKSKVQQYVYTGTLMEEDLASHSDIAALLGRELYNYGGELVFKCITVEVARAREVRKECILAGVYVNCKGEATALYAIIYLVKEACYRVMRVYSNGNGFVWCQDKISELREAVEIARINDVENKEPRDIYVGFRSENGFAVENYVKYYLRVCDAEKGPLLFLKNGGYVWK